jgi:hypothetical protein
MRFVADDGTEFDNEKECLEYEGHINDIKKCFVLYGEKLNKLTNDSSESVYYLHILEKPVEVATYLYDEYGLGFNVEAVDRIGIYYYDDNGLWKYVDDVIKDYTNRINELKSIATQITELSLKKIKEDL